MSPSFVLSRSSPCNVPQGYASVAELPAALLECHLSILRKCFTVALVCTIHEHFLQLQICTVIFIHSGVMSATSKTCATGQ